MTTQVLEQLGMNEKREVWDIVYDGENQLKVIIEQLCKFGLNPSHRWIPLKLVLTHNTLFITKRQANWLVDVMEDKKITFALKARKVKYPNIKA